MRCTDMLKIGLPKKSGIEVTNLNVEHVNYVHSNANLNVELVSNVYSNVSSLNPVSTDTYDSIADPDSVCVLDPTSFVTDNSCRRPMRRKDSVLSLGHVNVRSFGGKVGGMSRLGVVLAYLFLHGIKVCTCAETWLAGDNVPEAWRHYSWVGVNRVGRRGGGVGLFVSNDLGYTNITASLSGTFNFNMIEFCAISTNYRGNSICIVSVYLPRRCIGEVLEVRHLIRAILGAGFSRFVLGGDWNSSHVSWGSHVNNARGEALSDVFSDFGGVLLLCQPLPE